MEAEMKPTSSGYAEVNGINLYHEVYGQGEPLVLIHGGLTTIGEMEGWVQALAKTRQVIAVEMQGHGRTADTDRPMSFATMGDEHRSAAERSRDSESRLGRPFVRRRQCDPRGDSASGQGATAGSNLLALCQVRLVSRGAEGHEPGQRVNGRKQLANFRNNGPSRSAFRTSSTRWGR